MLDGGRPRKRAIRNASATEGGTVSDDANPGTKPQYFAETEDESNTFESVFPGQAIEICDDDDDNEDDDDDDNDNNDNDSNDHSDIEELPSASPTSKPAPPTSPQNLSSDLTEHTANCPRTRGPSTPPPPSLPSAPDPKLSLSTNLKYLRALHNRAIQFIPRLPLASHRYWIGILTMSANPTSAKNFTWMKGNRLTTIETVARMYQQCAAEEDVVLLLGRERPGWKVRMEELDYWGDRKVVLRAVDQGALEAKGVELCGDVVLREGGKGSAGRAREKKGKEEVVVIEIEDD